MNQLKKKQLWQRLRLYMVPKEQSSMDFLLHGNNSKAMKQFANVNHDLLEIDDQRKSITYSKEKSKTQNGPASTFKEV